MSDSEEEEEVQFLEPHVLECDKALRQKACGHFAASRLLFCLWQRDDAARVTTTPPRWPPDDVVSFAAAVQDIMSVSGWGPAETAAWLVAPLTLDVFFEEYWQARIQSPRTLTTPPLRLHMHPAPPRTTADSSRRPLEEPTTLHPSTLPTPQKRPVVIKRASPAYYRGLFSKDAIDGLLRTR